MCALLPRKLRSVSDSCNFHRKAAAPSLKPEGDAAHTHTREAELELQPHNEPRPIPQRLQLCMSRYLSLCVRVIAPSEVHRCDCSRHDNCHFDLIHPRMCASQCTLPFIVARRIQCGTYVLHRRCSLSPTLRGRRCSSHAWSPRLRFYSVLAPVFITCEGLNSRAVTHSVRDKPQTRASQICPKTNGKARRSSSEHFKRESYNREIRRAGVGELERIGNVHCVVKMPLEKANTQHLHAHTKLTRTHTGHPVGRSGFHAR